MATAGASIASMVRAEAATTAAAALRPSTVIMLTATTIVATVDRTAEKRMADRAAVKPTVGRMAAEHPMVAERTVVEHLTVAELLMAAEHTVVEHPMAGADTNISNL